MAANIYALFMRQRGEAAKAGAVHLADALLKWARTKELR